MRPIFLNALKKRIQNKDVPVIPDVKCISPKYGDLKKGRNPVKMAAALAEAGAPVVSVVTEGKQFGGSLQLLEQIVLQTGQYFARILFKTRRTFAIRQTPAPRRSC